MNPLFFDPEVKKFKEAKASRDERLLEVIGPQPMRPSALALRLGRLLIRMGSKLAHEDPFKHQSKDLAS